jgi:hypothetical protein
MNHKLVTLTRWCRNTVNNKCLNPLDAHGNGDEPIPFAPVFILGAPRCGSTLLSQLITQCLEVGYFSNFHAQLYGSPALAERLRPKALSGHQSDYASQHGVTRGWHAPSENAAFWYRFFRRTPAYVPLAEMPEANGRAFRRSIGRFIGVCKSPVVLKNLYAALRLEVIQHYLPEARFIVLHRNLSHNATSVLNGRYKVFGNYHRWWSVEPPNVDRIRQLNPAKQVVAQINAIYQLIETAERRTPSNPHQFFHLNYEDLCADPGNELRKINAFIPHSQLRPTAIQNLPCSFERKDPKLDDQNVAEQLQKLLQTDS